MPLYDSTVLVVDDGLCVGLYFVWGGGKLVLDGVGEVVNIVWVDEDFGEVEDGGRDW